MSQSQFDRSRLRIFPLGERENRIQITRDHVASGMEPGKLSAECLGAVAECVARIKAARSAGRPIMLAFGAHAIKNGLAPVMIDLMERGWITHFATNGAGVIHDWEFAYQGESSEHVQANVARGQFGIWQETGYFINLAIIAGAWRGLGYGESVGSMIEGEGLVLPAAAELKSFVREQLDANPESAAAAADFLSVVRKFQLQSGFLGVPHPFKRYSLQAAAFRRGVPFTAHPMFGHDIIYTHPINRGAAIGRAAERDFLSFADSISRIDGGVYLSVGSAVMSPMVFEKSFSMAQNLSLQAGRAIERHFIAVVDLAEAPWDWKQSGEPPESHPAYYLRYCKTFSRMGGEMRYLAATNRDFLLELSRQLA
jgi:hypothetical protein